MLSVQIMGCCFSLGNLMSLKFIKELTLVSDKSLRCSQRSHTESAQMRGRLQQLLDTNTSQSDSLEKRHFPTDFQCHGFFACPVQFVRHLFNLTEVSWLRHILGNTGRVSYCFLGGFSVTFFFLVTHLFRGCSTLVETSVSIQEIYLSIRIPEISGRIIATCPSLRNLVEIQSKRD